MKTTPRNNKMRLINMLMGDLLKNESMARDFATVLLKGRYGEKAFAQQQPLIVTDLGREWLVEGTHRDPKTPPEFGPWLVRMRKSDRCVLAFENKCLRP